MTSPRHINTVWAALLAATAITWALGDSAYANAAPAWAVPMIFVLAGFKGAWVILDFMELRHAPAVWRWLLLGWLTLVCGVIVLLWVAGRV
jgi:hypothetical protein